MTHSDLSCPHGNPACGDPGSPYMAQCQLCDAADTIQRLREAGDALAHGIRTGQWDTALDQWEEARRG